MTAAAPPALPNPYNADVSGSFQAPSFSINPGFIMNDALASALGMGGGPFYHFADNPHLGIPWPEYVYGSTPTSILGIANSLSPTLSFSDSSVYSTDESDLLSDEFLKQMNGCTPVPSSMSSPVLSPVPSPVTMHPNLVSTLKNMVAPGVTTYNAQPSVIAYLEQLTRGEVQDRMEKHRQQDHQKQMFDHTDARSAYLRHTPQLVVAPKVEVQDLPENVGGLYSSPSVADDPAKVKAVEKSETDDNIEAAVVSVDLIKNRRPFRCQYDGCNKTFKNPQTMKMHHKTHWSEGGAGGKGCSLPTLTSSLKAGHNKKIPSRCPKCKKTFVGLYELRRHYGRKHSEGEKPFGCRKCGKKFYIEVDVRDHEKLCGEPIECKCGLKFAFKCNLVAHKKAHPACQDNPPSNSHSTATTYQSSTTSDDTERSLANPGQARTGYKRAREDFVGPMQSSMHIPLPEFKEILEAPDFKMARHEYRGLSFLTETGSPWAADINYPAVSFSSISGVGLHSGLSNLGSQEFQQNHQQFSSKLYRQPIPATFNKAVNCEMGMALKQHQFKTWSG